MKHRHQPALIKKQDGFVHYYTDERGVKRGKVYWYAVDEKANPNRKRKSERASSETGQPGSAAR
jgi:hypothetical protein